jgi:hypothetical protein
LVVGDSKSMDREFGVYLFNDIEEEQEEIRLTLYGSN